MTHICVNNMIYLITSFWCEHLDTNNFDMYSFTRDISSTYIHSRMNVTCHQMSHVIANRRILVTSHIWMSRITNIWVVSRTNAWMTLGHVLHLNESCHKCMSRVTNSCMYDSESRPTFELGVSQMYESCHKCVYVWLLVTSHIWISRITLKWVVS